MFRLRSGSISSLSLVLALAMVLGLATPQVAWAEECVRALPSITPVSATAQAGSPGDARTFTVTLTNNDSIGCYASEFVASPIVPFDWSGIVTPSDPLLLEPQQSVDFSLEATPSFLAMNGAYNVIIEFLQRYTDPSIPNDYFGFAQYFTYKVVGSVYSDLIRPVVTIYSPTETTLIKKNNPVVINAGAYDNVGVTGMTYSVDGVTLCNVEGVLPICAWTPTQRGTYTIVVIARDSAGNVGTDSVVVRVK